METSRIAEMLENDLYNILGLPSDADDEEIKRAYRQLAQRCHPDRNPEDIFALNRFKEISAAYQILSDPDQRAKYDELRREHLKTGKRPKADFLAFGEKLSEIFDTIFGPPPQSQAKYKSKYPQAGGDINADLTIGFEMSIFGGKQNISIQKRETCPNCQGTGGQPASRKSACPDCQGQGTLYAGGGQLEVSCPTCEGKGVLFVHPCIVCHGDGEMNRNKQVVVSIPQGIRSDQVIRLKGEGENGTNGGPNGDLAIQVQVEEHEYLVRKEDGIYSEEEIDLAAAVLGATLDIKTLDAVVTLEIPAGVQPGAIFQLRGHGAPIAGSDIRGDHFVTIRVHIPEDLDESQKDLFRQFARAVDLEQKNHQPSITSD